MYQFSYAEIQHDSLADAKDRERQLLDRSIELMTEAETNGPRSREAVEAVYFVKRVWIRFIEDLGAAENELDQQLRANLISVGLWILREAERVRVGELESFAALIDITRIIRDGLK